MAKKILVVDDEPEMLNLMRFTLEQGKYEVATCDSGRHAWQSIIDNKPDLILLDITMPKMDGIAMLRELRKREDGKRSTPVFVLTNLEDFAKIAEATELGALGYLQKSEWHLDDVVKKVKETLGISS